MISSIVARHKGFLLAVILGVCVGVFDGGAVGAQQTDPSLARGAESRLANGEYNHALTLYAELLSRFANSPERPVWLYNQGRAYYHLERLSEAERVFRDLAALHGEHPLAAYALYLLGNTLIKRGDGAGGGEAFVRSFDRSRNAELDALIVNALNSLGDSYSGAGEALQRIPQSEESRRAELLRRLDFGGEVSPLSAEVAVTPESVGKGAITLALPLSGKFESYGQRIERGVLLANRERSDAGLAPLELAVFDTEGDPSAAARIVKQAQQSQTLAMIGPLTSDAAVAVSAMLNCGDLVALAPAASQRSFVELSDKMYQMTPSPAMVGRRLAEYAFIGLPVATAAVVAPNSENELQMAEAFSDRFTDLGGEIVSYEVFPERATDYGDFCRTIKRRFLGGYEENAVLLNENGDTLDLDEAAVEIGCIFAPATTRQLQLLLPQINYHHIVTTLIGSDGMSSARIWEMPLQNVRRLLFSSTTTQDPDNLVYQEFAGRYRDLYGESPDRLAAVGYDAAKLLAQALESGVSEQRKMKKFLEELQAFAGASGEVSFGADRINDDITIYTVQDNLPVNVRWRPPALQPVDTK